MDIGGWITKQVESGAPKQSALAAMFVERSRERGVERNRSTVESHLSRLKSNDRTAAQFFFGDPRDARDLLDVLAFPPDEHDAVLRAAGDLLRPEERPVRLIVDMTGAPQDRAFVDACESLHGALLDGAPPRVVLVMTRSQREFLLPKYAPEGRVTVALADDATEGAARTQQLAGEGALVVSAWRFPELARWVAVRWPQGSSADFILEPSGAREILCAGLHAFEETTPSSAHDLSLVAPDAAPLEPPKRLVSDGVALRRLIVALQNGEAVARPNAAPAERAAWAKHLGVHAVATPHEWAEHLVGVAKGDAVKVTRGTEQDLRSELTQIERGAKAPRVVVVGTAVHVINPATGTAERLRALPGLTVHTVTPRVSAATRLRAALAETSQQALFDDPYLEQMVAGLVEGGADRAELAFVAACMLANDAVRPPEAPRSRAWLYALRAVTALDPPAVGLRLPRSGTGGTTLCAPPGGRSVIGHVLAAAPPRLRRGEDCRVGSLVTATEDAWGGDREAPYQLSRRLSFQDDLAVYNAFERSPFRRGDKPPGDHWDATQVELVEGFWHEADRHLAATWLALRRAAKIGEAVTLHDGVGMLEMGSGVLAEVSAYEVPAHPREAPCEADLLLPLFDEHFNAKPSHHLYRSGRSYEEVGAGQLLRRTNTRVASTGSYAAATSVDVPHSLFLAHANLRFVVTFRVTPWDLTATPAAPILQAAAAEAAHQAEDDD